MEILKSYTKVDGRHSFFAVTRYTYKSFDTCKVNPIKFWSKILSYQDEHITWKFTTLLVKAFAFYFKMLR